MVVVARVSASVNSVTSSFRRGLKLPAEEKGVITQIRCACVRIKMNVTGYKHMKQRVGY